MRMEKQCVYLSDMLEGCLLGTRFRQTASGRLLFAAFTIRANLIRVISVRDMNNNETEIYKVHQRNA